MATLSEYKAMWLMVLFDLPVKTKEARREYAVFRKSLIREGFIRLQFSVYTKFCASRENAEKYFHMIKAGIPPEGEVRLLMVTDKQFGEMVSFYGKTVQDVEKKPEQLLLF